MRNFSRYGRSGTLPREVGPGWVLAHNHVQHTLDMRCSVNGFRWWRWPAGKRPRNFRRCKCGWSGLPHFAIDGHVQLYDTPQKRKAALARAAKLVWTESEKSTGPRR
jgi:hypothetical protein